jgi:nucleoside-diphosphate-sugar epimerase
LDTSSLSNSLLIFGCGYVGLELARQSLKLGWSVTAFTRNQQTAEKAEEIGARSVTGILQDRDWWDRLSPNYDHVVNSVGAYSPTLEGYQQSYLMGMQSIIDWLEHANGRVKNLLFTSSSSVYPQTDGSLVNEKSEHQGVSARGKILLDAERVCLQASEKLAVRRFVVRLSGLYGPGRHLLVDKIRRQEPMSGNPERVLNLTHRDDAASAVLSVLQSPDSYNREIFNACDGQHSTRGEIVRWVAKELGIDAPKFLGMEEDNGPDRRVDNTKLIELLGWSPKYPSFQCGYQDFLARE